MRQIVTKPDHSRAGVAFGILGLLAALIAGGMFYYLQLRERDPDRGPEATVEEFLTVIFDRNGEGLADLVCAGWEPGDAAARTTGLVAKDIIWTTPVDISWRDVHLLSRTTEDRAVVSATVGVAPIGAASPSPSNPPGSGTFRGWTFNLVDQDGWKVCEARPII